MDTAAFKIFAQETLVPDLRVAWMLGRCSQWDTIATERDVLEGEIDLVTSVYMTATLAHVGEVLLRWDAVNPECIILADVEGRTFYEFELRGLPASMLAAAEEASEVAVEWASDIVRDERASRRVA